MYQKKKSEQVSDPKIAEKLFETGKKKTNRKTAVPFFFCAQQVQTTRFRRSEGGENITERQPDRNSTRERRRELRRAHTHGIFSMFGLPVMDVVRQFVMRDLFFLRLQTELFLLSS